MSWVKKADTGGNPEGMTWEEFQKGHKFAPMVDPVSTYKWEVPFLSNFKPEELKRMIDERLIMDPLSYQAYIHKLLGIIIPDDKMEEFLQSLERSYNSLRNP